jgi:hypothetical protein
MTTETLTSTREISIFDRILLLLTGILAGYQIAFGIDGLGVIPTISYMVAFGALLIAGLLIIIMGFEVLDSPAVVVFSTLIPLSLSAGLVAEYKPRWLTVYLSYAVIGFLIVLVSRVRGHKTFRVGSLIVVHGIAGITIFLLPIIFSISGDAPGGFSLVGVGGALIGVGGLLLSFLKSGKPILSKNAILTVLPALLFAMMLCFVLGFLNRGY